MTTWIFDRAGWWRYHDGATVYVGRMGNSWQGFAADKRTKIDKPFDYLVDAKAAMERRGKAGVHGKG
jgi:hypothetical protein